MNPCTVRQVAKAAISSLPFKIPGLDLALEVVNMAQQILGLPAYLFQKLPPISAENNVCKIRKREFKGLEKLKMEVCI